MKNKINLPDPLASWEEKKSDKYGLSMAYAISKEWFNGGMISDKCEFGSRRDWVQNKRLVARGEQDDKKYKEHISRQEGDLEYLNLDWKIINIPEKFCNIVSNGIRDEYYTLDIRANDRTSIINRKNRNDQHRKNMISMPLLKKTKEVLGIDLLPKGFVPENEEELLLYSEIKERPKIEIAEGIIIDYVKKTNNWHNIEDAKNKDLVEVGVCASRTWTDPENGIKVEYTDVERFVHSHVNKNDFSDAYYYGYVDSITIHDIQRESNLKEQTLREIAKIHGGSGNGSMDWSTASMNELYGVKVDVLRYTFKTNKKLVYKKYKRKGKTTKVSKRDEEFNPKERSDYGKIESIKSTWMEGSFVLGSEYVYNYKESENLVRDEQDKALPPFTVRATNIYKNKLHSFLDNIEPLADQMQYIHLKIQHLIAEIKPDLIVVDIDSLAELTSTTKAGKKQETWEHALNIMNVKGVIFKKRVDMGEMGMKDTPGAQPMPSQQGSGLEALLNAWAHYYNLIREATGINPARDGTLPHDALLGVNKMAELASNTATQHIVDASVDFNKRQSETISSRIHNIFRSKNAAHLKKVYEKAVGKHMIDALEIMKDRHLHDFGFTVEYLPTKKEMEDFKEDLAIALNDGSIDVEIKSEAQAYAKTSLKLAHQYLFFMRKKRRKEMMEEEERKIKLKSEGDMQAAQSAAQSQAEAYGMKKKMDLEYEGQMAFIRVLEKQAIMEVEGPDKEREFQQEVFLKKLEVAKEYNMKNFLENRKDDRTKIQASQQSKLIDQRTKENSKPIDFENNAFSDIFSMKN